VKKAKKIVVLILVVVLALISLTACKAGVPNYDLTFDPVTQEGTANFTVRIPKNDVPEVGNNFDKKDEAGYIKSPEALLKLFKNSVPKGYEVTLKDEPNMVTNDNGDEVDQGNFAFTVTFSFKGIEDYNKKIMDLVGQSSWDGANSSAKTAAEANGAAFTKIEPATLTIEPDGDKQVVTFQEDLRIIDVIGYWAYTVLTTDKTGVWNDIYKDAYPDYPVNFGNTINLDLAKYTIDFGGNVQEYRHSSDMVTVKATVDAVETVNPDTASDQSSNNDSSTDASVTEVPKTGENQYSGYLLAAVAAVLFIGAVIVSRKMKKAE
jgi:LPXTG-motif cell wall-anchored protein